MQPDPVLFDVGDGIATLTLNAAAQMNPIGTDMLQACLQALARVREDPAVRALVLTGRGKAFCSGANLSDFDPDRPSHGASSAGRAVGDMMADGGNPLVMALYDAPVPVVCAMNGVAAGGGVGLALAADVVIAARSSYFYLPFAPALGLVPDMGASWVLPRTIGRARALGLSLLGGRLSAQDAARWGLIWSCVEDATLLDESMLTAKRLALLPAHAVQEVRSLYRASEGNALEEQLGLEMGRQTDLADRESFAEGVRAFRDKRKPGFLPRS